MKLNTSYRQILSISVPIMLASATQNIIVLCDNIFLNHVSRLDFAAIGVVGVFYLIISSIGYGFSRGAQILIARRYGEGNYSGVGNSFQALLVFEVLLASVLFLFLQLGSPYFFSLFIDNEAIYEKCLEYIYPRSYGIFFSYIGVSLIALYTGIAKTKFIIYDTIILTIVNVILNYIFIFGAFGISPMGIAGAGLASTLSEVIAFVVFLVYMVVEKGNRKFKLLHFSGLRLKMVVQVLQISAPIVIQSVLIIGSWFVFFSLIENIGTKELEISNLLRNIYLILSVPCWGFSAGINTIVSNFIGQRKRQAVLPIIRKTAFLNLIITALCALPVVLFPVFFLYPVFGLEDMSLIYDTIPYLPLLFAILLVFSLGSIYMNGLLGTGHTYTALFIQALTTTFYLVYTYYFIVVDYRGLNLVWLSEVFYWILGTIFIYLYLKSKRWHRLKYSTV